MNLDMYRKQHTDILLMVDSIEKQLVPYKLKVFLGAVSDCDEAWGKYGFLGNDGFSYWAICVAVCVFSRKTTR